MIPQWEGIHNDPCLFYALSSFIAFIYALNSFIALSSLIAFIIALNTLIAFHYCFKYRLSLYALNTLIAFTMWIIAFLSIFTTLL